MIQSLPYHPHMACEACVFGTGPHAAFCEKRPTHEPLSGKAYWDLVERTAAKVDKWPDWKKGWK